jgi:oligopeptide transport system ATP-binding protein
MPILADTGRITEGGIFFKGEDITKYSSKQLQSFRGKHCSIVFQDPMTSLNPVYTVVTSSWRLYFCIRIKTAERRGKERLRCWSLSASTSGASA